MDRNYAGRAVKALKESRKWYEEGWREEHLANMYLCRGMPELAEQYSAMALNYYKLAEGSQQEAEMYARWAEGAR